MEDKRIGLYFAGRGGEIYADVESVDVPRGVNDPGGYSVGCCDNMINWSLNM